MLIHPSLLPLKHNDDTHTDLLHAGFTHTHTEPNHTDLIHTDLTPTDVVRVAVAAAVAMAVVVAAVVIVVVTWSMFLLGGPAEVRNQNKPKIKTTGKQTTKQRNKFFQVRTKTTKSRSCLIKTQPINKQTPNQKQQSLNNDNKQQTNNQTNKKQTLAKKKVASQQLLQRQARKQCRPYAQTVTNNQQ